MPTHDPDHANQGELILKDDSTFELPPEGAEPMRLVYIHDRGMIEGSDGPYRGIIFVFLTSSRLKDGRPFEIEFYTEARLGPKNKTTRVVNAIRATQGKKPLTDQERRLGLHPKDVIGGVLQATIEHEEKGDRVYANLKKDGFAPLARGQSVAELPTLESFDVRGYLERRAKKDERARQRQQELGPRVQKAIDHERAEAAYQDQLAEKAAAQEVARKGQPFRGTAADRKRPGEPNTTDEVPF